jgi:hypothetical protein
MLDSTMRISADVLNAAVKSGERSSLLRACKGVSAGLVVLAQASAAAAAEAKQETLLIQRGDQLSERGEEYISAAKAEFMNTHGRR